MYCQNVGLRAGNCRNCKAATAMELLQLCAVDISKQQALHAQAR
jgi:hypothetical protein